MPRRPQLGSADNTKHRLAVDITKRTWARINQHAQREGLTASQWVRAAIEQALKAKK